MQPLRSKWRPDSENSENSVQYKFLPKSEVTERHTLILDRFPLQYFKSCAPLTMLDGIVSSSILSSAFGVQVVACRYVCIHKTDN